MHVGLIAGIGPAATDFYYRRLISTVSSRGKPLDLTMAHADVATLLQNQITGNSAAQVAIYRTLTERLEAAGAKAVAITSIAGHFCIEDFKEVSPLPVIDLLAEVDRELVAHGYQRVGILGTRLVMETGFYGVASQADVIAPAGMLDAVHEAYVTMAASGAASPAQREVFFSAGQALIADGGAEAVMLGGTDLVLAFKDQDPGFDIIDCAAIHADAIAAFCERTAP